LRTKNSSENNQNKTNIPPANNDIKVKILSIGFIGAIIHRRICRSIGERIISTIPPKINFIGCSSVQLFITIVYTIKGDLSRCLRPYKALQISQ